MSFTKIIEALRQETANRDAIFGYHGNYIGTHNGRDFAEKAEQENLDYAIRDYVKANDVTQIIMDLIHEIELTGFMHYFTLVHIVIILKQYYNVTFIKDDASGFAKGKSGCQMMLDDMKTMLSSDGDLQISSFKCIYVSTISQTNNAEFRVYYHCYNDETCDYEDENMRMHHYFAFENCCGVINKHGHLINVMALFDFSAMLDDGLDESTVKDFDYYVDAITPIIEDDNFLNTDKSSYKELFPRILRDDFEDLKRIINAQPEFSEKCRTACLLFAAACGSKFSFKYLMENNKTGMQMEFISLMFESCNKQLLDEYRDKIVDIYKDPVNVQILANTAFRTHNKVAMQIISKFFKFDTKKFIENIDYKECLATHNLNVFADKLDKYYGKKFANNTATRNDVIKVCELLLDAIPYINKAATLRTFAEFIANHSLINQFKCLRGCYQIDTEIIVYLRKMFTRCISFEGTDLGDIVINVAIYENDSAELRELKTHVVMFDTHIANFKSITFVKEAIAIIMEDFNGKFAQNVCGKTMQFCIFQRGAMAEMFEEITLKHKYGENYTKEHNAVMPGIGLNAIASYYARVYGKEMAKTILTDLYGVNAVRYENLIADVKKLNELDFNNFSKYALNIDCNYDD